MRLHPARVATYHSRERRDLVLLGQLLVLFRVDLEHYKQAKVSEVKQKEFGGADGWQRTVSTGLVVDDLLQHRTEEAARSAPAVEQSISLSGGCQIHSKDSLGVEVDDGRPVALDGVRLKVGGRGVEDLLARSRGGRECTQRADGSGGSCSEDRHGVQCEL